MAATVTFTQVTPEHWIVDIVETTTAYGQTVELIPETNMRFPRNGRVMRVTSGLVSGTASTIQPALSSSSTDFVTSPLIFETGAGPSVDEQPLDGIRYGFIGNSLYWRSNPNAGSNNSIKTRILIVTGWE